MRSPLRETEGLVELDRRALRFAHVEIEGPQTFGAGARLDRLYEHPREPVTARPRRHELALHVGQIALRLVVARRLDALRRPAHHAVEARDEELALGPGHESKEHRERNEEVG